MSEDTATYAIDVRLDHRLRQIEKQLKRTDASDPLLTVKDVAGILKASPYSVNKLFNSPGFPGKKISHIGWRVRRSRLFEYLDNLNQYQ